MTSHRLARGFSEIRKLEGFLELALAWLVLAPGYPWGLSLAGLFAGFVVTSENRVIDVRPEFFEDVEKAVEADLGEPFLSGLGPGAFGSGVIKIGDPRSCAVADNFGEIEGAASRIGSGNQKTAYGIAGALEKPAVSERVVSRVFVSQRGDDGFRHVISNGLVSDPVPIVAAERFSAVAELRVRVICLADTGDDPRRNES